MTGWVGKVAMCIGNWSHVEVEIIQEVHPRWEQKRTWSLEMYTSGRKEPAEGNNQRVGKNTRKSQEEGF